MVSNSMDPIQMDSDLITPIQMDSDSRDPIKLDLRFLVEWIQDGQIQNDIEEDDALQ